MPLTVKEKRMMANLVDEKKFIDKEFSIETDGVECRRPHELVDKPELFVDGPNHMDVMQQNVGSCWFLCAASVVAQHPHLIQQVIPSGQCLYGSDYQGILVFRFWNLGQWKTVYIDDTLPVDENGDLIYSRCTKSNEFWLPLLEKAFAKFHGSYNALEKGFSCEALLCLTGYLVEDTLKIKLNERQLYDLFEMEIQHNSLITTGTEESSEDMGMISNHSYSVTGVYTVFAGDSHVRLVRVRNPWGDTEWNGLFSDELKKWPRVDAETLKKLEYVDDDDGQFFMRVDHFKMFFHEYTVAASHPNFGDGYETPAHQVYHFRNVWKKGISLQGEGIEYAENFLRNPQYLLTVEDLNEKGENESVKEETEEEEEEEEGEEEDETSSLYDVIIQLVQDQHRTKYEKQQSFTAITVFQEKEKRMMAKLAKEKKFIDKEFSLETDGVERKRPHELIDKPELFIDGPSHMDVKQKDLGDCWFLCVASIVAQHPHLIHQVIPSDQCLYGSDYNGILVFRFWNLGQWKTVYIDDTLPVDENGDLIYSKCTKSNEFWLPLLEKAFAKFHGSYSALDAGWPSEALVCLTGYIVEETLKIKLNERQLYDLFEMELQHNSLIATGTDDADEEQGIHGYHAYSVTGAYTVRAGDSFVRLVRVRNPWGDVEDSEWKGAFSDKDPKWTGVDAETRKKLEYVKDEDGQFFMKAAHFKKHLPEYTVAARYPNFGDCYRTPARQVYYFRNVWEKGISLEGDGIEYAENFLRNPQYLLTVEKLNEKQNNYEDDDNDDDDSYPIYDVIIQLVQDQHRTKYENEQCLTGVTVFQTGGRYPEELTLDNFEEFEPHRGSTDFEECCSVIARLRLSVGKYIVIPCIFKSNNGRPFLMRVYSSRPIIIEPIKREE